MKNEMSLEELEYLIGKVEQYLDIEIPEIPEAMVCKEMSRKVITKL